MWPPLNQFAQAGKLGLLLFQLPPNFKADAELLRTFLFLSALHEKQSAPPIAFEFRHESWFDEKIYAVLGENTTQRSASPRATTC